MHNLVKSFLTLIKFTFDNLSRKIKISCLVINKNFLKEDFTMKSKQIIIMLLSFIILFAISCKNEDKTGGGVDEGLVVQNRNHPPAGRYTQSGRTNESNIHTVTHNGNGSCTISGKVYPINDSKGLDYEITVTNWLNYPNITTVQNLNYVGTSRGGEYTITKPESSIALEYFDVIYDFTTETIFSISLRTVSDSKYYGELDLKKVN